MEGSSASNVRLPSVEGVVGRSRRQSQAGAQRSGRKDKKRPSKTTKKDDGASRSKTDTTLPTDKEIVTNSSTSMVCSKRNVQTDDPSVCVESEKDSGACEESVCVKNYPESSAKTREVSKKRNAALYQDTDSRDNSSRHSVAFDTAAYASKRERTVQFLDCVDQDSYRERSITRSRSGSRAAGLTSILRKSRSSDGYDRSKSDTDIFNGYKERSRSSDAMTPRSTNSLDGGRDRRLAFADLDSCHSTSSLDRDFYYLYSPTRRPRERLRHMTVKEALSECRHRQRTPPSRSPSVDRQRRHSRLMLKSDVSGDGEKSRDQGSEQTLTPKPGNTGVKTSPSIRRIHLHVDEDSLQSNSPKLSRDHVRSWPLDYSNGQEGDSALSGSLGEQILQLCRTITQDHAASNYDVEERCMTSDKANQQRKKIKDDKSSVTVTNTKSSLPISDYGISEICLKEPINQNEETVNANQIHSNSKSVDEPSTIHTDKCPPDSCVQSELPMTNTLPKNVETTAASNTPPVSGLGTEESPTVTVNMDTSFTMDTSMVSSTDQGFFSEPRDSDTDSDAEMSGFNTPLEDPDSERDSARNSFSSNTYTNNLNFLDKPRRRCSHRLSVDDTVRSSKDESAAELRSPSTRRKSSKSDSFLLRKSGQSPPSSSVCNVSGHQPEQADRLLQCAKDLNTKSEQDSAQMKSVPVMGTSVQQRYCRTFCPVRTKPIHLEETHFLDSVTKTDLASLEIIECSQTRLKNTQRKLTKETESQGSGALENQDDFKSKRGKHIHRHESQRSSRPLRRKTKSDSKDLEHPSTKSETHLLDENEINDGMEEHQHRKTFQDKSIQTSLTLLNELVKKRKRRKLGMFSSNGKTSKREESPNGDRSPVMQHRPKTMDDISHILGKTEDNLKHHKPTKNECSESYHGQSKAEQESTHVGENALQVDSRNEYDSRTADTLKSKALSLRAIVLLKQKIARNRKKREERNERNETENDDNKSKDEDLSVDSVITFENELNPSKLAEIKETDIVDDDIIEPDLGPILLDKQLRFDLTVSGESIQTKESLPSLTLETPRRPSIRRNSVRLRERRRKIIHCCKKFIAFLFSHIGLCSLVVGYTILGGIIFRALELPYEQQVKTDVKNHRVLVMERIKSLATGLQLQEIGMQNWTMDLEVELLKYQAFIHKETTDNGWDGNEIDPEGAVQTEQWSLASALLYAITVMTTIGYGHVVPKTLYGRLVTIAYAVLGIPLTLLCLTNIGDVMASGFRLLYGKVCCGLCCKLFQPSRRRRRRIPGDVETGLGTQVVTTSDGQSETDKPKEVIHVPTSLCLLLIAAYIFAGSLLFSLWEQWDFLTGSYFCFITLSTIGFGDIVPGMDVQSWSKESKLVLSALYLILGLSLIAMCFNLVQEDVRAKCRWLGMKIGIIDKPQVLV